MPISCCNEAADYLVAALGGPERANNFAGGTRWWQVRGLQGIDANWVVAKKDIEALRKAREKTTADSLNNSSGADKGVNGHEPAEPSRHAGEEASYTTEMDSMPCMFYLHGGKFVWILRSARSWL